VSQRGELFGRSELGAEGARPRAESDAEWALQRENHQGLSFRFGVRCDDAELGRHLAALLESLGGSDGAAEHWYSLTTRGGGAIDLSLDDEHCAQLSGAGECIDRLLWDINRASAEHSNEHLLFHAGSVAVGGAAVLLPAASGGGKSTLVTALVRAGAQYLSDELIALTFADGRVLPYPKPLAIKAGSFEAVRKLGVQPMPAPARFASDEWYLRPDDIRSGSVGAPCRPAAVIVPRYAPSGLTRLTALTATETFLALALNSVNLEYHGQAGTELLGDLVEHCPTFELEMSDLEAACHLVFDVVEQLGASGAR
jgi:hypothetical protein